MDNNIEKHLSKFNSQIKEMFIKLRMIVYSTNEDIKEKLWAGLPSYYVEERFVRLIPFSNHINIEAKGVLVNNVIEYKKTNKGMLQIYLGDKINEDLLLKIFIDTFMGE